ncbi:glycosyltransferase family 2 protein [bacterium]|nr:glycosyltransferase family 2 protein [candidate division CSSED10-310 bacterium]
MSDGVSVVIPAYNEVQAVGKVVLQILEILAAMPVESEVVLVDDGSIDDTGAVAAATGCRVLRHERNRGYGAALKTGIAAAVHERVIILDADGTYPVDRISALLEKATDADMVIAARTGSSVAFPMLRAPARKLLTLIAEFCAGTPIQDFNSGFRLFKKSHIESMRTRLPDRFSFSTTTTMLHLFQGLRVTYISIDYHPRIGRSKLSPIEFFRILGKLLRLGYLYRPGKVYILCASAGFLLMLILILAAAVAAW